MEAIPFRESLCFSWKSLPLVETIPFSRSHFLLVEAAPFNRNFSFLWKPFFLMFQHFRQQKFISLSSSIQIINETIRDVPPTHEWVAAVYKLRKVSRDVKQITNRKDDVLIARLRSGHHPSLKQYPSTRSFSRSSLLKLPPGRSRSRSLAPRLSSSVIREATSVWVPSRVIRVACHPTGGCSGVRKEDPGQPWRLTLANIKWLSRKHTHTHNGTKSVSFLGPVIWDSVPNELKNSSSIQKGNQKVVTREMSL